MRSNHLMQTRAFHIRLLGGRYDNLATRNRAELVALLVELLSLDEEDVDGIDIETLRDILQQLRARKKSLKRARVSNDDDGDDASAHKRARRAVVEAEEAKSEVLIEDLYFKILGHLPLDVLLEKRTVSARWRMIIDDYIIPAIREVPERIGMGQPRAVLMRLRGLRTLNYIPYQMNADVFRVMTKLTTLRIHHPIYGMHDLGQSKYVPTHADLRGLGSSLTTLALSAWGGPPDDEDLPYLTNLTRLELQGNTWITDEGISILINLATLAIGDNFHVSPRALAALPKLETLALGSSTNFRALDLVPFTNITTLYLGSSGFLDGNLRLLVHLTKLNLGAPDEIVFGHARIRELVNLTDLDLGDTNVFTDAEIAPLTALTTLVLGNNAGITSAAIGRHTKLVRLATAVEGQLTDDDYHRLVNLEWFAEDSELDYARVEVEGSDDDADAMEI